jgi:hypothetical protein
MGKRTVILSMTEVKTGILCLFIEMKGGCMSAQCTTKDRPFKRELLKQKRFPSEKVSVSLYTTPESDGMGRSRLAYVLKWDGKTVFEGDDYFPAPSVAIDSLDAIATLLGWLTLQKGDTDSEYFENYTPLQWEWTDSRACEIAKLWADERERRR